MLNIDLPEIHQDDLIPVEVINGITVSRVNLESARKRADDYTRSLITIGKKEEN